MVWTVNSTLSWGVYNCLMQWNLGLGWSIVIANKLRKSLYIRSPQPLSWTKGMPPEKRRENGVGREEGRRSVSALYHELQASICQKRPIFRIPYFRPSKCRPLESAAGGECPPPLPPPLGWMHDMLCDLAALTLHRGISYVISSSTKIKRTTHFMVKLYSLSVQIC